MKNSTIKHIAIAGNIGVGKTTLATLLARHFHWEVHYEDVELNPYLHDFYNDMSRWSFNLQIYFLSSRLKQIFEIQRGDKVVVQDRTIYEDALIFAPNLYYMGLMNQRDFDNYKSMFNTVSSLIQPPDLLIYLRASLPKIVSQIQKRGRDYEENLRMDYLKRLNEYYENWIKDYKDGPLLIIDIDHINFEENPEDFGTILENITGKLYGLF
ncbi:MAG: deoxynucleoside kinase [Chitinophagales bacterium]|nr:deoxynucleoside kinase [Bacteroidota bacterium]